MAFCNAAARVEGNFQLASHKRADAHQRVIAFTFIRICYKLHSQLSGKVGHQGGA